MLWFILNTRANQRVEMAISTTSRFLLFAIVQHVANFVYGTRQKNANILCSYIIIHVSEICTQYCVCSTNWATKYIIYGIRKFTAILTNSNVTQKFEKQKSQCAIAKLTAEMKIFSLDIYIDFNRILFSILTIGTIEFKYKEQS